MKYLLNLLMLSNITTAAVPISRVVTASSHLNSGQDATDLNTVISNKDLGQVYCGQSVLPSETQIKKSLKLKNPNLMVDEVTVGNITSTSAIVSASTPSIYTGETSIRYEVNNFIQMSGITTAPNISFSLTVSDKGIVYAASQEINHDISKLYKSVDGINFSEISSPQSIIYDLFILPNDTLWVKSTEGIYVSSDEGNTFTLYKEIPEGKAVISWGVMYILSGDGIYKSVYPGNYGLFVKVFDLTSQPFLEIHNIISSVNGEIYFCGVNNNTHTAVFYVISNDHIYPLEGVNPLTVDSYSLVTSPDGTVYAGGVSYGNDTFVYKLDNNSSSCVPMPIIGGSNIRSLVVTDNGTVYAVADPSKIYKSVDGKTFSQVGRKTFIAQIIKGSNNSIYTVEGPEFNLIYRYDNDIPQQMEGTTGQIPNLILKSNTIYALGYNGIFKSELLN